MRLRDVSDGGVDKGLEPDTSGDDCADCVFDVNESSCDGGRLGLDVSVKVLYDYIGGAGWLVV